MHHIRTTSFLAALLAASAGLADGPAVYTTADLAGDWDSINWTTNGVSTTAIPGNHPLDVVNFPYQNPATGPYKLNGPRTIGAIGNRNNGGWTLEQTNPGDTLTLTSPYGGTIGGTLESPALFKNNVRITFSVPIIFATNVYVYANDGGDLSITKPWTDNNAGFSVTKEGNGTIVYSDDSGNRVPPVFGDLIVRQGWMKWTPLLTETPAALDTFGNGTMRLNGGGFYLDFNNSTTNGAVTYASGPVETGPGPAAFVMTGNTKGHTLTITDFDVKLGGPLLLGCYAAAQPGSTTYQGSFKITHSNAVAKALAMIYGGSNSPNLGTSPIEDADGGLFNLQPLVLKNIARAPLALAGDNTYAAGTLVDSIITPNAVGIVSVAAGSSLGTGDVAVRPGGRLRLAGAANVAEGRTVTLTANTIQSGYLGLGYDGAAPLAPASVGILGIDTSYSQPLDLSTLGNGAMFLGCSSSGTYTAASLGAGADGRHRLGGGGGTLIFATDALSPAATGMQIGSILDGGNGIVRFNTAQSHTLPVTVTRNATLEGSGQPEGSSPFGRGAVTLEGGSLTLRNNGARTFSTNSVLAFTGASTLRVNTAGNQLTTMMFGSLERDAAQRGTLAIFGTSLGSAAESNVARVVVENPPATVPFNNGAGTMVPPWLVFAGDRSFLTYGPHGFTPVPWSTTTDLNNIDNNANEVVATSKNQTGAAAVAAPVTVHALRSGHTLEGAPVTITSGGLILAGGGTLANDINFGAEAAVYAYENVTLNGALTATGGFTLFGELGRDRTTILTADNSATLNGLITINSGILQIRRDDCLGSPANEILLNGGTLRVDRNTSSDPLFSSSRTLRTGLVGGKFISAASRGVHTFEGAMIIDGPLTVGIGQNNQFHMHGPIRDAAGKSGSLTVDGSAIHEFWTPAVDMSYSGGTLIRQPRTKDNINPRTHIRPGSRLGTGDVIVEQGVLILDDDQAIAPSARLWTGLSAAFDGNVYNYYYNETRFQTAAPEIGSLEGLGNLLLGYTGIDTTLTLGGDNTDSAFHGTISQYTGRTGTIVKTGSGTFTFGGAQEYTGDTTVQSGTLRLVGSLAGGLVVDVGATLTGRGEVKGGVSIAGTLAVTLRADGNHDFLAVGGTVGFAGNTAVVLVPSDFVPAYNEPIPILTAAEGVTGKPSTPDGFSLVQDGANLCLVRRHPGTLLILR